jgi:CheY-like chemotaxis protein
MRWKRVRALSNVPLRCPAASSNTWRRFATPCGVRGRATGSRSSTTCAAWVRDMLARSSRCRPGTESSTAFTTRSLRGRSRRCALSRFGRGRYANRDPAILPVVVLLDLKLPRLDGIEVLKAIRADEVTCYLPVVMLTSSDHERDRLAAYHHHANSYIKKPVDYDQFVEAARHLGPYWAVLNSMAPARR